MAKEIERKFLVKQRKWAELGETIRIRQGYLSTTKESVVRVRTFGPKAYMTVKGLTVGATRDEYEYEIPVADADAMLDRLCARPLIEKTRYRIPFKGLTWEVDEFFGVNQGLTVAEVEIKSESESVTLPDWVDKEVTGDPKYYNANLIAHPYTTW
jgi:adenylate cyclase